MPKILNPNIYEIARLRADEKYSKPSAYKSMFIVKTYKELGGMYADDGTPKNLDRWKKEQWKDIAGLDYPVYRPTKRISKKTPLTISEIEPENLVKQSILKQKIKGSKNLPPFEANLPLVEGGKRSAKEIKKFLDASYQDKPPEKIDGWILDKKLSNDTGKVYYNPKTKEAVVAHRGTKGLTDWGNNLAYALGMYEYTSRFKKGKSVQDKAEAKYGKKNISTLGHSQGSILSRKLGADTKEIINVNPAYLFETPAKNEYNIRSSSDVVSGLFAPVAKTREILFPKYSKKRDITIPAETDVIGEHSYSILDRLGEKEIGRENKEQENKILDNNIMKGGRKIGLDEKIKQLVYLGIPQDAVALLLHTGNLNIVWSEWVSGNDIKPILSQVLKNLEPREQTKTTFNLNTSNTDEDPLKEMSEPYNVEDAVEPLENKETEAVAGGGKKKRGGGAGVSTPVSEEERLQRQLDIIEPRLTRYFEEYERTRDENLIANINWDYNNRNNILRRLNIIRGVVDDNIIDAYIPSRETDAIREIARRQRRRLRQIPRPTTAQIVGAIQEGAPEQLPLATDIRRVNSRDDMSEEISVAEPVGRGRKKRGGMIVNRGTNPYGVIGGKVNIGKSFKKMGKSVSKSFNPVSKAIDNVNKKTTTGLAKVGTAINPAGYALGNRDVRNAMIQSGKVTHDYLLPAVVSAGKPIFDATAMVGSTMLTGNPILGKAVADTAWNEMVTKKGNDPRQNQKSKELGVLSGTFGKALSKPYSASLAGKGRGGKSSRWVDFVRMWAKDHDTTYGCALSQPECSKEYRAKYGITKKVPRKMENEMMGMEDKDAAEVKKKQRKMDYRMKYAIASKAKKAEMRRQGIPIPKEKSAIELEIEARKEREAMERTRMNTEDRNILSKPKKKGKKKPDLIIEDDDEDIPTGNADEIANLIYSSMPKLLVIGEASSSEKKAIREEFERIKKIIESSLTSKKINKKEYNALKGKKMLGFLISKLEELN
jgi:hypothetical protein